MERKELFNELGSDTIEDRKLIGGNSTGILNLNTIKYKWATNLLGIMQNNFWFN